MSVSESTLSYLNMKRVSELCTIHLGGTPRTSVTEFWNGDIKWVTAKDVSNCEGRFIKETERSITKKAIEQSNVEVYPKGTIIITARGTVGKIAILDKPMAFNQTCYGLEVNSQQDKLFIFYAMKNILSEINALSYGTVFQTITIKTFDDLFIGIPSLRDQKAIAKILSDLDAKIELDQKMNKTLEDIAQAIFKHWFIDFEFPNEEGKPYKSSGGEMVDSELGRIPKGWKISALGDSIKFTKGKKPSEISSELRDSFAPLILINMLDGNEPIYGNAIGMNFIKKYYPIMVMDGASSGRVELGFEGILGSTIASITAKNESLSNFYIYYCLKRLQAEIIDNTTGTSIPHADKKRIETKRILIPSEEILLKFNEFSKNVTDSIFNRREQISSLRNIRDLALPKLISGKIRVPVED